MRWIITDRKTGTKTKLDNPTNHVQIMAFWKFLEQAGVQLKKR